MKEYSVHAQLIVKADEVLAQGGLHDEACFMHAFHMHMHNAWVA